VPPAYDPAAPPKLSVVVPAYNEAENLQALLEELEGVLASLPESSEVVVVDDGSTDATAALLAGLQGRYPRLRAVTFLRNAGQSAAFAAGMEAARGEVVVTMDADLQNDPADIPRMLPLLAGADVVCGIRRRRRDSFLRRVSSRVANAVRRAVIHDGVQDTGCSLKLLPRRRVLGLPRFNGMHRFLPALLQWEGCRVAEVAVNHRPRRAGQAKYNLRNRLFRTLVDLLGVRWLHARRLRYEVKP
jgi:dolichol-phosphate mannosyltransferase